ncbi:MAG: hypothetical protein Q9191_006306, partial [Dirinaria sp. TL-2023a]
MASSLPQGGLVAIAWAAASFAGLFVAARAMVRWYKFERFAADDYWIYFAWTLLCINAVLITLQAPYLYYLMHALTGTGPEDDLKAQGTMCSNCLSQATNEDEADIENLGSYDYKKFWHLVAVFTVLAYIGCWISSILNCHPASLYFEFGKCIKPEDVRGATIAVFYSTAADVATDLMIMALPLNLLWNLQVTRKQKLGLVIVFSVAVIIICVAIVRAVQIHSTARSDGILLNIWSIIESSISNTSYVFKAVCVGCLPPFKSLFTSRRTTAPQSPILKSFYIRSSSSPPRRTSQRWLSYEPFRGSDEVPIPPSTYHNNSGNAMHRSSTSNNQEPFTSRGNVVERHVDAIKTLKDSIEETDAGRCDGGGVRVQHDF